MGLVGHPVTVVAVAVPGGSGAPGGVVDADGEGGGSDGVGKGAAGDVTAGDVDGEGAVPGRSGRNISGPDVVVVVGLL